MTARVVLFGKACCPLCDEAKDVLERVRREVPFEFEEVDIEADPELFERYRRLIPVVTLDGAEVFYGKVSAHRLKALLGRAGEPGRGGARPLLSSRYAAFLVRLEEMLAGGGPKQPPLDL